MEKMLALSLSTRIATLDGTEIWVLLSYFRKSVGSL